MFMHKDSLANIATVNYPIYLTENKDIKTNLISHGPVLPEGRVYLSLLFNTFSVDFLRIFDVVNSSVLLGVLFQSSRAE